jgi:hypothetical protein
MKKELRREASAPDGAMERLRRDSLLEEARAAASELGHLLRRSRCEAPEVHARLRSALEALQLLTARLSLDDEHRRN